MSDEEWEESEEYVSPWGQNQRDKCPFCSGFLREHESPFGPRGFGNDRDGRRPRRLKDGADAPLHGFIGTIVGLWNPPPPYCPDCSRDTDLLIGTSVMDQLIELRRERTVQSLTETEYINGKIDLLEKDLGVKGPRSVPDGVMPEISEFVVSERERIRELNEFMADGPYEAPAPVVPPRANQSALPFFAWTPVPDDSRLYEDYVAIPKDDIALTWDPATGTATVPFGAGEFVEMVGGKRIGPRSATWECLRIAYRMHRPPSYGPAPHHDELNSDDV